MSQQYSRSNRIEYNGCGCLVLLIFIGIILAAILPDLMPRLKRSAFVEGESYVTSLGKGQQALFLEKGAFTKSIDAMGLGIKAETEYYKYSIRTTEKAAFHYGVSKHKQVKSYVSAVFVVPAKEFSANAAKDEITTIRILCKNDFIGPIEPAEPIYQNGQVICGKGTTELAK